MAKRLDWEKDKWRGRPILSVKDERDYRDNDRAARWLERVERDQARTQFRPARQFSGTLKP
jgi:ABC-type phosphonate transport system ATPase subunit